jgi:hypothetical protein
VKGHWTDLAVATLLVGASCAAIYAGLARILRRTVGEQQRETDRQLRALESKVAALQARVAELDGSHSARVEASEAAAASGAAENMVGAEREQMKPETLVAITAAATAFLGKTARVRSAQALPAAQDTAGAWAQQGRMIVQTSHNLLPRR